MAAPRIIDELKEHPAYPLPRGGSVHVVHTREGYALRVGLWPAPGFEIRVGAAPQAAPEPAEAEEPAVADMPPGDEAPAVAAAAPAASEVGDGQAAPPGPGTTTNTAGSPSGPPPAPPRSAAVPQATAPVATRGTVIVLHGRAEFIEKYGEVIGELVEREFCVVSPDWRGQGGSERLIKGNPRKGHIDHIDSYVDDLVSLLDFLDTTNCPTPFFCLAHSTGGQVLLRAAPLIAGRIRRAVTTAPFLALAGLRVPSGLLQGFAATLTYLGLGELYAPGTGGARSITSAPFDGNRLSADPRRYNRTDEMLTLHPELALGGPTISWIYAALTSAEEIRQPDFVARITLPILMLSASEDRIVSSRAIADFAETARTATHIGIPGARHEILMERDEIRSQFWAAFDAFIPGDS